MDIKKENLEKLLDVYNASLISSDNNRYILDVPADTSVSTVNELLNELESLLSVPDDIRNSSIFEAINALNRAIKNALFRKCALEKRLVNMVFSLCKEIDAYGTYFPHKKPIIGDIVIIDFGYHMDGELYGRFPCIVLDSTKLSLLYVAPIYSGSHHYSNNRILDISSSDIQWNTSNWRLGPDSHLHCMKTNWVNICRVTHYCGTVEEIFMDKILKFMNFDPSARVAPSNETVCSKTFVPELNENIGADKKLSMKELLKITLMEHCNKFREHDGFHFMKVNTFINDIGMEDHPYVINAFNAALYMAYHTPEIAITFGGVLSCMNVTADKQQVRKKLTAVFNEWRKSYPELVERKGLSFIHLVQLFVDLRKERTTMSHK